MPPSSSTTAPDRNWPNRGRRSAVELLTVGTGCRSEQWRCILPRNYPSGLAISPTIYNTHVLTQFVHEGVRITLALPRSLSFALFY